MACQGEVGEQLCCLHGLCLRLPAWVAVGCPGFYIDTSPHRTFNVRSPSRAVRLRRSLPLTLCMRPQLCLAPQVLPDRNWAQLMAAQKAMYEVATQLMASERRLTAVQALQAEQQQQQQRVGGEQGQDGQPGAPSKMVPVLPGLQPGAFLRHMLSAGAAGKEGAMSDLQIAANVITFIVSGILA